MTEKIFNYTVFILGLVLVVYVLCFTGCDLLRYSRQSSTGGGVEMIAFIAEWCTSCREIYPELERMLDSGVRLTIIDVDSFPDAVKRYDIKSVPTFIVFFRDGKYLKTHDLVRARRVMNKSYRVALE